MVVPEGLARTLRRASAVGLLLVAFLAVVRSMDVVAQPASSTRAISSPIPSTAADRTRAPLRAGSGRLFVFLIDSLRLATATDPAMMPTLCALRARSVVAETVTTWDAVTMSALRAAFTGRDSPQVLGFADGFWGKESAVESLLGQAKDAGLRTSIYSAGRFFRQFGPDVADFHDITSGNRDEMERENQGVEAALDDYRGGAHDIVILHVTYTDHRAHEVGIHAPRYADAFLRADRSIREIDAALSPDDTLVVMGDHGHEADGRHAPGLSVRTYSSYRGPGFARGVDLGTIALTEHRYLMSWALGLPLVADYAGGRHPEALVPAAGREAPAEYRIAVDPRLEAEAQGGRTEALVVPSNERANVVAMVAQLGLVGLAFVLLVTTQAAPIGAHLGVWAAALLLAFPSFRPWNAALGIAVGLAWVLRYGPTSASLSRRAGLACAAVFAALALFAWGQFLAGHSLPAALQSPHAVAVAKVAVMVAAAAVSLRAGPMRVAWALLAVSALFFMPTISPYGSMPAMAPVWASWAVAIALSVSAPSRPRTFALAVAVVALVSPFAPSADDTFHFMGIDALTSSPWAAWFWVALAAKLVVFLRPKAGAPAIVAAVLVVGLLTAGDALWIHVRRDGSLWLAAFAFLAFALRAFRARTELRRVVTLGFLWVAYVCFVRVPPATYASAHLLLAALSLSAALAQRPSDAAVRRSSRVFLLAMGAIASGWMTLAWSIHHLEWAFLYDWLDAGFVEHHVGLLMPLLLARYAIPVLLVRTLIARDFEGDEGGYPGDAVLGIGGVKLFGLTALVAGIGVTSFGTDVYMEAAEQGAIVCLLLCGLAFELPASVTGRDERAPRPGPRAYAV